MASSSALGAVGNSTSEALGERLRDASLEAGAGAREVSLQENLVNPPPTPRYAGELCFALSAMALVLLITAWVLAHLLAVAGWKIVPPGHRYLLTFLAFIALFLGIYVLKLGVGTQLWVRKYAATKDQDFYKTWQDARNVPGMLEWIDVQHFVIILTNSEDPKWEDWLESVANTLACQRSVDQARSLSQKQVTLVLAVEEWDPNADQKIAKLVALKSHFRNVLAFRHPAGQPDEIPGKAANFSWALSKLDELIRDGKERITDDRRRDIGPIKAEHCIIHKADGDSLFDPNYLPNVTYDFCRFPRRYEWMWQPCVIPACNIWDMPFCSRLMSISEASEEMLNASSGLGMPEFQLPHGTYGLALDLLRQIGGEGGAAHAQDGDVVADDHHLFIKGFFATQGRLTVRPVFLPCFRTAVVGCEWASRCPCLSWLFFCDRPMADRSVRICDSRFAKATKHLFGIAEFAFFFSLLCRGCRKWNFGLKWYRVVALFMKLVRIHSLSFQGLWVTMGSVLIVMYAGGVQSCLLKQVLHPKLQCGSQTVATFGGWLFKSGAIVAFLGYIFVVFSFVKMLQAMHQPLRSIADPNRTVFQSRSRQRNVQPQATVRAMGGAWCGTRIQLTLEVGLAGLATSFLYYGVPPGLVALWKLIRHGHRMGLKAEFRDEEG